MLLPRDTHELAGHQHAVDRGRHRLVIGVMLDAHRRLTGQNQPYGPHVLAKSVLQPGQGGPGVDGEPGLGEHPQEGGDGVLPAALDADVLRQRTEEALDPGLEQCGRPVLAAQGHGQGVTSGRPGGPVGGRLPAGVGGGGDGLASLGQTAGRLLMDGSGPGRRLGRTGLSGRPRHRSFPSGCRCVVLILPLSPGLGQRVSSTLLTCLGGLKCAAGLLEGGQAGLVTAAGGGDASTGAGDRLASLRDPVLRGRELLVGGLLSGLRVRAHPSGVTERRAGRLDGVEKLGLLPASGLGPPFELLGVGAVARGGR